MRYRAKYCWWECLGFDGEGCALGMLADEIVYYAIAVPGVTISRD